MDPTSFMGDDLKKVVNFFWGKSANPGYANASAPSFCAP